jgi:hypothetical protein
MEVMCLIMFEYSALAPRIGLKGLADCDWCRGGRETGAIYKNREKGVGDIWCGVCEMILLGGRDGR